MPTNTDSLQSPVTKNPPAAVSPAPTFTPGPWMFGERLAIWSKDDDSASLIASCASSNVNDPTAEELANAALIAAAPDLLAALKNLLVYEDRPNEPIDYPAAYRAIAKAEGRS